MRIRIRIRIRARTAIAVVLASLAPLLSTSAHADSQTDNPVPEDVQAAKMIQELNQINPFAQHSPRPSGIPEPAVTASSSVQPNTPAEADFEMLKSFIDNKWVQKYLRVLSDPVLQNDAFALINSPERVSFLLWEAGWVVFMLIFKIWRMTKVRGFWRMMFTQLWTFAVFLAGVVYLVPRYVLGQPYLDFVHAVFRVIR